MSGNKPIFCISLDTELIWGRVHLNNYQAFIPRAKKEYEIIPEILKLFQKYDIPATWAIVGHMMLNHCDGKHSNVIRPNYKWLIYDWFKGDLEKNKVDDKAWYGIDLLQKIQKQANQEIASHSFSHYFWGEKGISRKCVESDIREWIQLAKKLKIKASTFIYPKNSIGFKDVLKDNGFTIYRGRDINWFERYPKKFHSILQIVDFLLPISPASVKPSLDSGLVNIPGSFYFLSARGVRKFIPKGFRAYKAKLGIDTAIAKREIFHLWTHPTDFADQTEVLLSDLEEILKYASKMRKLGKLEIMTMGEIGRDYLAAT